MTVEPLHIPNKKFSNDASGKTYYSYADRE